MSAVLGVDLSNNNGKVSAARLRKAGVAFVIDKATEGLTFNDSTFADNRRQAISEKLVHAAYHFAHPSNDATREAEHFLSVAGADIYEYQLPHVLDLEITNGCSSERIREYAATWLAYVKAKTGRTPFLYTSPSFAAEHDLGAVASNYPLWIAEYGVRAPQHPGWPGWALWQYTQTGSEGGYRLDCSIWAGDLASLHACAHVPTEAAAKPKPTTKPAPTPHWYHRELHTGCTGNDVKTVRRKLRLPRGSVYDRATARAVESYQTAKDLHRDGVVGPATARALGN